MFAILETGGKQVKAVAGRHIEIEKLPQEEGEKISLNTIMMLVNGKESKVGNPYIKGAVIHGQILKQGKDDKVIVYKMRPKKGTRKKQGHRQLFSRLFVEAIELDGKIISKADEPKQKIIKSETTQAVSEEGTKQKKKSSHIKK